MLQTYKKSFLVVLGLIFLIPLIFVPGATLGISNTKSFLLVLAVVLAGLLFLFETWKRGEIESVKHYFVVVVATIPVVYLLSALLATPASLSLIGYNFEIGTFGFMLLGSALLLLSASVFSDPSRYLTAVAALFASLSLITLFAFIKLLTNANFLSLGNFMGKVSNPLGSWTDLGVGAALLAILSSLIIGMIPMKRLIKALIYVLFILSTLILVVTSFPTAFLLALVFSIALILYFAKLEKHFHFSSARGHENGGGRNFFAHPTFLPIILAVVSLLFLINPVLPGQNTKLGPTVSGVFGVENTDVRPTLSATLGISKAVLSQTALLGSGPNTFGRDWLIFKPLDVNATPFWGITFPFGVGFIPTQVATTGIVGSAVWIIFLGSLLVLSIKSLSRIPESRALRFSLVVALSVTIFLWLGAILYTPSLPIIVLSFIFTGIFLALCKEIGVISSKKIEFKHSQHLRFSAALLMSLAGLGVLWLGWSGVERVVAAYHFNQALSLSEEVNGSVKKIEDHLNKAVKFSPVDTHFLALSRFHFALSQKIANSPDGDRASFEASLGKSIEAARAAVRANPAGFGNWVALGLIYTAMVPPPLSVEGAYENAQLAFSEALRRNPNNPELPLLLAQLEVNHGDTETARSYLRSAIALKEDYGDAYLMLAQLEVKENNIPAAIRSAEALAALAPNNPGVHFELGVLKYSQKDYQGALESLSRAVTLEPKYANAKYYLALSHASLGHTAEARAELESLLEANPDSVELKEALKALNR